MQHFVASKIGEQLFMLFLLLLYLVPHHLVQLHQDEMRLFGRIVELTHLYAWKSMVS